MTSTQLIPRLSETECQEREDKIYAHAENLRALLLELYEGQAWLVRGFENWQEYVVAKFDKSASHLYRLLHAALLERELQSPIGEIPESQLRELAALDDPLLRQATWQAVQDQPKLTAQIVKRAVNAAAEWANEYLVSKGHTSLEGKSLEVAKSAITERMLETRQRQIQHIADSVAGKWDEPIKRAPCTVVKASEVTGRVILDVTPDVAKLVMALIGAEGLRLTIAQPKPKPAEQSAN